jgi:hypothetical protein
MKVVMHELDYDMDDDDLQFLEEINQYMKTERMKSGVFFFSLDCRNFFRSTNHD